MHASAKGSHPCPGPCTPSLSSLGRQLGKNKSGLSVMHPGKKSVSSLITASSVVQGGRVCKCKCTHCLQVQAGVQEHSLTCGCAWTHLCMCTSEWLSACKWHVNFFKQTTHIYSIMPKIKCWRTQTYIYVCVFRMMYENTNICTPFLPYVHTQLFYCNIFAWVMDKGKRPYVSTFLHLYEHTHGKMYVCLQCVYILCPYPYTGTFL